MTAWTDEQLDAVDAVDEVDLATRRADGTLRGDRIVWAVRHEDAIYVRSVNGTSAAWYRGAQTSHEGRLRAGRVRADVRFVETDDTGLDDVLDAVYRRKYGRWPDPVDHITAPAARATTLRIDPLD